MTYRKIYSKVETEAQYQQRKRAIEKNQQCCEARSMIIEMKISLHKIDKKQEASKKISVNLKIEQLKRSNMNYRNIKYSKVYVIGVPQERQREWDR